jgi:hypothetical protein
VILIWVTDMMTISLLGFERGGDLVRPRPADFYRRLVLAGLMAALVFALSTDVRQFEVSKECSGAFSSGFSRRDFDVHHCDLALKRWGEDTGVRVRLAWFYRLAKVDCRRWRSW